MDKEKHIVLGFNLQSVFFSILHTWQTLYAFMKFFELSQIKPKKLFIQNLKFL
jgi:hypothetical protein